MSKDIVSRIYEATVERGQTLTFRPICRGITAGAKKDEIYKIEISSGTKVVEIHVKDWELVDNPERYLETILWKLLNDNPCTP